MTHAERACILTYLLREPTEAEIEEVAEALCGSCGSRWDEVPEESPRRVDRGDYRKDARAALLASLRFQRAELSEDKP